MLYYFSLFKLWEKSYIKEYKTVFPSSRKPQNTWKVLTGSTFMVRCHFMFVYMFIKQGSFGIGA